MSQLNDFSFHYLKRIALKLVFRFDEPFDIRSDHNGSPRNISYVSYQLGCDKYTRCNLLFRNRNMVSGYEIPIRIKTFSNWFSIIFSIIRLLLLKDHLLALAGICTSLPFAIKNRWLIFDITKAYFSLPIKKLRDKLRRSHPRFNRFKAPKPKDWFQSDLFPWENKTIENLKKASSKLSCYAKLSTNSQIPTKCLFVW